MTSAEFTDGCERLLGVVALVAQALQLLPAVGELVDLVFGYRGERGPEGIRQELQVDPVPDLRGAHHAEDADQLVQPGIVAAVERAGDGLAVGGAGRMHYESGHIPELRRFCDKSGGRQRQPRADSDLTVLGAPAHLERTVGPPRLGEKQEREEVGSVTELQPCPAAVLLLRRVAPVQGMVGRLHVIAEMLVALTQRVDVVAGDVAGQQEQRCQRHERRLARLVRALQLHPAVGVPDLCGVVLPQVHHACPLRLPTVGTGRLGQLAGDRSDAPRREFL
ncbi:MAG TPA: hypothetical protein VFE59_32180 [Trebonia sp.]|nr:hypothetical protein [Trebonia sp.]